MESGVMGTETDLVMMLLASLGPLRIPPPGGLMGDILPTPQQVLGHILERILRPMAVPLRLPMVLMLLLQIPRTAPLIVDISPIPPVEPEPITE